jgi:hypothetical protein
MYSWYEDNFRIISEICIVVIAIKKHTKALLGAIKEADLEVNVEKIKCTGMLMSRHQNAPNKVA